MPARSIRVLVVDDFKPWRDYICSLLQTKPEFHCRRRTSEWIGSCSEPRNCTRLDLAGYRRSCPTWIGSRGAHPPSRSRCKDYLLNCSHRHETWYGQL
jgi:hypothetical protein